MEGNKQVRTYKEYKYLGTTLNREGTDDQEINNRITKAKRIIVCLNGICEVRKKSQKKEIQHLRMVKRLYGCETWRLTERSKRALEAKEMKAIR